MAAQTSMIHVRVDEETKLQATQALAAMGLSVADAVRLFLHRVVVDQAFPLELKVPNAETIAAMKESRSMMSSRCHRFATAGELFDDLSARNGSIIRSRATGTTIVNATSVATSC